MTRRLVAAFALSLLLNMVPLACPSQQAPEPDAGERARAEQLKVHEERVQDILRERKKERAKAELDKQTASQADAKRSEQQESQKRALQAERRLRAHLDHPEIADAYRADAAARRTRFESRVRSDSDLMALATKTANARVSQWGPMAATAEQVDLELDAALVRVFEREQHLLEGRLAPDLDRRLTFQLKDADSTQVANVFAERGVSLRFEGAPAQARLNIVGSELRVSVALQSLARQAKGSAWLLADNTILITDGDAPADANPVPSPNSSRQDFPEFKESSSDELLTAEVLTLCSVLYTELVDPGSTKVATPPAVQLAPPPEPAPQPAARFLEPTPTPVASSPATPSGQP